MTKTLEVAETQVLLDRVRNELKGWPVIERKMFGGVTLMLNGNMLCCVSKKGLMLRVGKAAEAEALKLMHASPCDGAGHKMPGFVMIAPEGLERALSAGVKLALDFVSALRAKEQLPKATSLTAHKP